MTLNVYTARVDYKGPDALDITRKSATEGLPFAPSKAILYPLMAIRKAAETGLNGTMPKEAHAELQILHVHAWTIYVVAYMGEMRLSYKEQRKEWDALLARPEITLTCYCRDSSRCHRVILARQILKPLGAIYKGER